MTIHKLPPFLQNDEKANQLYNDYLEKYREYLDYIKPFLYDNFTEDVKDKIMIENYYFGNPKTSEEIVSEKLDDNLESFNEDEKKKIKKLYVLCHPDKNTEFNSQEIFLKLKTAKEEKNLKFIDDLYSYWKKNSSIKDFKECKKYTNVIENFNTINIMTNSLWYCWLYKPWVKDYFKEKEVYVECEEKNLKKLKKDIELWNSMVDSYNEIIERLEKIEKRTEDEEKSLEGAKSGLKINMKFIERDVNMSERIERKLKNMEKTKTKLNSN
jgi:hypothetical protein